MVEYLLELIDDAELPAPGPDFSFVDLGTGNGHLLFALHEELLEESCADVSKYQYVGVDYSPDSVSFASDIVKEKFPLDHAQFRFEQADLLAVDAPFLKNNAASFDVLLDKGTLDAIALNQDPLSEFDGRIGMDIYAEQVSKLMHDTSLLLITSCNFTEEELIRIITANGSNDLSVFDRINYPSFQFGGVKGSTICSVAFSRAPPRN